MHRNENIFNLFIDIIISTPGHQKFLIAWLNNSYIAFNTNARKR